MKPRFAKKLPCPLPVTMTVSKWSGWFAACVLPVALSSAAAGGENRAGEHFRQHIRPILSQYCYDCHGDGMSKGNVAFDGFKSDDELLARRDLWFAALKNLRAGLMPPEKKPRPSAEELRRIEQWIKQEAFGIDPKNPDPGRVTIRRLNRVEYRNTIRDLMGVEFNSEVEFPPDDTGGGFDNLGEVLTLSPLLMEKYMQAAANIVGRAVPTVAKVMPEQTFAGDAFRGKEGSAGGDRFSFYNEARLAHGVTVKQSGRYRVVVELEVRGAFDFDPGRCRVVFQLDGQERFKEEYAWHESRRYTHTFEEEWQSGEHQLAFDLHPLTPASERRNPLDLRIVSVQVQGPLAEQHWTRPENYPRFFPKGPAPESPAKRADYAREILREFAGRAFRRPVDDATVKKLAALAGSFSGQPGKTFEAGIARAMMAVLASPRFLFRVEETMPGRARETFPWVDEYSLAARLSYFLWSTMPDEELTRLAARGELRKNLPAQLQRLLADPRSQSLVRHFTGQWLQARDVEFVPIDARVVLGAGLRQRGGPRIEFDAALRRAMRNETEMLFAHVLHEDHSVLELIDASYTFLNQRLASHYGIEDVKGEQMRRVELPAGSPRGGLLTQGTVLTVTSNPTRTSPVKRGLFILENILGTPVPPPPPNVPDLEEARKEFKDREPTLRETLEMHRAKPLCNSCHNRMDPLGLALENFNALGIWRDKEAGQPIDSTGKLITGEPFASVHELKHILTNERHLDFYRCLTEKLLTYALGRSLEYSDVETVDQIVERLEREHGRFSALLDGIVESAPFQKQRNRPVVAAAAPNQKSSPGVQPRTKP